MLNPFTRRRGEGQGPTDPRDRESMWELPDMEPAIDPEWENRRQAQSIARFRCDETPVFPAGVYTAELVGWEMDRQRVEWRFTMLPDDDLQAVSLELLEYLTGTVYRPGNHLCLLLAALGLVDEADAAADPGRPGINARVREAVAALNPQALIGRRCRVRVVHVRNELGDVFARIGEVAPVGGM